MQNSFTCKCCGHCCEGKGGIIVSPKDLTRLCAFSQMSADEFTATYLEKINGKLRVRSTDDGMCIFFVSGKGCTVHVAKPDICRAWPYFRGNLIDPESLALAKDFCPGIPSAISFSAFQQEGIAYLHAHNLVGANATEEAHALVIGDILHSEPNT